MKAYRHWEDGKQWLRIIEDDGNEYDEQITGWSEILDFSDGKTIYRHKDGREIVGI